MLTRYRQMAVQIEDVEGTHETGEAAGDLLAVINPEIDFELNKFPRDVATLSLTPYKQLSGIRMATLTFQLEVSGRAGQATPPATTVSPPFDALLRSCGFRQHGDTTAAKSAFIDDGALPSGDEGQVFTGTLEDPFSTKSTGFDVGEVLDQEGSAATLIPLSKFVSGDPRIFLRCTGGTVDTAAKKLTATAGSGTVAIATLTRAHRIYTPIDKPGWLFIGTGGTGNFAVGDVVQGSTSNAVAFITYVQVGSGTTPKFIAEIIPGSPAFAGAGEAITNKTQAGGATLAAGVPSYFDMPTVSLTLWDDGNRYRLEGCRGNVVLTATTGSRALFNFTMTGGINAVDTAAPFAAAAGPEMDPNMFLNGSVTLSGDDYGGAGAKQLNALVSEISIDGGRTVAVQPDVNALSGMKRALLTNREMRVTLDPEAATEDAFDFIQRNIDAEDLRLSAEWGIASPHDGNGFAFHAPAISYDTDAGDRDGTQTWEIDGLLTGASPARGDEFVFASM